MDSVKTIKELHISGIVIPVNTLCKVLATDNLDKVHKVLLPNGEKVFIPYVDCIAVGTKGDSTMINPTLCKHTLYIAASRTYRPNGSLNAEVYCTTCEAHWAISGNRVNTDEEALAAQPERDSICQAP